MAEAPAWLPAHGALTSLIYLGQLSLLGTLDTNPFETGNNVFVVISQFFTLTILPGLPVWFGAVLFMVITLPWLFLLLSYALPLANTTVGLALLLGALTLIFGVSYAGFFS